MPPLTTIGLAMALATGAAVTLAQQGPPQPPVPIVPIVPIEQSDLMLHSPLTTCAADSTAILGNDDAPSRVRIATWNIQAARAAPVSAIADELRKMEADIIALQEVDQRVRRTAFIEEPSALAAALGFDYAFAASIKWDGGDYGLAVLSRWPLSDIRKYRIDASEAAEPRIVLEVSVCVGGRTLRLFNHHADNRAASRDRGFALIKELVQPAIGRGVLVMGDFNQRSNGTGIRGLLDAGFVDLLGDNPALRFDYILADGLLARRSSNAQVWQTDKSDHNAVLADLDWQFLADSVR